MKSFNKSKFNNIREKFIEWSLSSTSHGFPNIFRTSKMPIRIMWLVFLTISISLCSYLIMESIFEYLEHDVITKIREIAQEKLEYPALSICK